jgi:hypothetical protein
MLNFDNDRLRTRIAELYGGNAKAVVDAWPQGFAPPDGSTVTRWIKGTPPRTVERLLGLAATLDLDPFALWRIESKWTAAVYARVLVAVRTRRWSKLHPALSFLDGFVGPTANWPPREIAPRFFGRPWAVSEFRHQATERRNYFASVRIEPKDVDSHSDRVWHFAWRDDADSALWRPYGFVRLTGNALKLYSFSGVVDQVDVVSSQRFWVETWFGEGAARFRVASLHPFSLKLECDDTPPKAVRFGFPRVENA